MIEYRCPRCESHLPESEFGVCRSRATGRNLYDKKCVREQMAARRAKQQRAKRKPNRTARPIWMMPKADRVCTAFQRGITDRVELRRVTRLTWDELTDAIAVLNDQKTIRWNRKLREFEYAA